MQPRIALLALILTSACASAPTRAVAPPTCPAITPPGTPYPYVTYSTMVLDGRVLYARRGQRNIGSHASVPLDSVPGEQLPKRTRIKHIRILTGDSARFYEACPGIPVIAVDSERRHWWWPW